MYTWDSQAAQYPPTGPPGISYFCGGLSDNLFVDCLLYRDETGELVGILNQYPVDIPPFQRDGDKNIWVHPGRRRQGIGTALLLEAWFRWGPRSIHGGGDPKLTESGVRVPNGIGGEVSRLGHMTSETSGGRTGTSVGLKNWRTLRPTGEMWGGRSGINAGRRNGKTPRSPNRAIEVPTNRNVPRQPARRAARRSARSGDGDCDCLRRCAAHSVCYRLRTAVNPSARKDTRHFSPMRFLSSTRQPNKRIAVGFSWVASSSATRLARDDAFPRHEQTIPPASEAAHLPPGTREPGRFA